MKADDYAQNELEFLTDIAADPKHFGLTTEKGKLIFVQRFLDANNDLENNALAEVLGEEETTVRDCLRPIYKKFEAQGCDFQGIHKGKRAIAQKWLREVCFPLWFSARLWDKLKTKATTTNKMGAVVVEAPATLGMRHKETILYQKDVPLGSNVKFEVNLDEEGHLILLEKEPGGAVCCLCPSEYAPETRRQKGVTTLPQYPPSPYPCFEANEEGIEQFLAFVMPEFPPFPWLSQSRQQALELDKNHLSELLSYIEGASNSKLFYTDYEVS